jgi:hypothetical protein
VFARALDVGALQSQLKKNGVYLCDDNGKEK